jgi:hypothetical protein
MLALLSLNPPHFEGPSLRSNDAAGDAMISRYRLRIGCEPSAVLG